MATFEGHALRRSPARRSLLQNLALLLVSLVVGLLLCELLVRAFVPVRNIGPTFSVYDPYYGKVLKRNFKCERIAAEFTMLFTTNSLGFRGPEPRTFPEHGILFLGDSFTSGYGVNDGEEFPDLIRRMVAARVGPDSIPVVNAGSGNTGNGYWVKFLKSEVRRFSPRLVILQFCGNDFEDNVREQLYTFKSDHTLQESNPAPYQEGARFSQRIIEAIPGLSYSHLIGLARQWYSEGRETEHAVGPPDTASTDSTPHNLEDSLTVTILDEALRLCSQENLPAIGLAVEVQGRHLAIISKVFQEHNVDLLPVPVKKERPELYYHVDGHWNAAGHRFVADLLMRDIDEVLRLH